MNSLYNSALRQGNAIRRDLDAFSDGVNFSPALMGQINASLTSFSRTIEDYNKLAKQELVPEKQTKAYERLKTFRSEIAEYRDRFEKLKKENEEKQITQASSDLSARRPHLTATPDNPYTILHSNSQASALSNRYGADSSQQLAYAPPADFTREDHAFREQSFLDRAGMQMDEFLERGANVLGDLGQQKDMLKRTQRKLYSVGNTLGISGDTIRMVERRARQDKWVFWGGVVVFFGFCYLVLHFLR